MSRHFLLGFLALGLLGLLLLSARPAQAQAVERGVITAVMADRFTIKDANGRVSIMYPDKNVMKGKGAYWDWDPKRHGGRPSPFLAFGNLKPGMKVGVLFRSDVKQNNKIICIQVWKDEPLRPERTVKHLQKMVERLQKENARLKEENKVLLDLLNKQKKPSG